MPKSEWAKWKAMATSNYKAIIVSACAAYALVALASSMSQAHTVTSTHRPHIIRDVNNRIQSDEGIPEDARVSGDVISNTRGDITTIDDGVKLSNQEEKVAGDKVEDTVSIKDSEAVDVKELKGSSPDSEFTISTTPYNFGIDVVSKKDDEEIKISEITSTTDSTVATTTVDVLSVDNFNGETKSTSTVAAESETSSTAVLNEGVTSTIVTSGKQGPVESSFLTTTFKARKDGDELTVASEAIDSASTTTASQIPEAEEEETTKKQGEDEKTPSVGTNENTTAAPVDSNDSTTSAGQVETSPSLITSSQDDTKNGQESSSTIDTVSSLKIDESTTTMESSNSPSAVESSTLTDETTTIVDLNLDVIVIDDIKKKIEDKVPNTMTETKNTSKLISELGEGNNQLIEEVIKTTENIGNVDSVDVNVGETVTSKNNDDVNFELQKDDEKRVGPATDF